MSAIFAAASVSGLAGGDEGPADEPPLHAASTPATRRTRVARDAWRARRSGMPRGRPMRSWGSRRFAGAMASVCGVLGERAPSRRRHPRTPRPWMTLGSKALMGGRAFWAIDRESFDRHRALHA